MFSLEPDADTDSRTRKSPGAFSCGPPSTASLQEPRDEHRPDVTACVHEEAEQEGLDKHKQPCCYNVKMHFGSKASAKENNPLISTVRAYIIVNILCLGFPLFS